MAKKKPMLNLKAKHPKNSQISQIGLKKANIETLA